MKNLIKKNVGFVLVVVFLALALLKLIITPVDKYLEFSVFNPESFIKTIEAKTFDMRQKFLSQFRHVSDDIVLISLDNLSFEYMTEFSGHWPLPRKVYVDMINYVESFNPKVFALDVNFVGEWEGKKTDDVALANLFRKYDNLYTGLYFDNNPVNLKRDLNLPYRHAVEVVNHSNTFTPSHSASFRLSYNEMIEKGNLGVVNLINHADGISRAVPMFITYSVFGDDYKVTGKKYYPSIALKIISKLTGYDEKVLNIDNKNNLYIADRKIPMESNSEVILNWYKKEKYNVSSNTSSFYTSVPFKDVYISIENIKQGKRPVLNGEMFRDKIVLFGYTADSLFDIRTVPIARYIPGVELFGVFTNNFIDNSFIRKLDIKADTVLSLCVLLVFLFVFYISRSFYKSLTILICSIILFIAYTCFAMFFQFLWIPIIMPILGMMSAFVIAFFLKYFTRIKDMEKLSKLINIDELTGLYNKRFFNENMNMNLKYSSIYNRKFAIIMIDIDHFKKFNDTYGHLSGDAVLQQTAAFLKDEVGQLGVVCRYGGEEICVILPHADYDAAYELALRLRKRIDEAVYILANNEKAHVTISLGVSVFPDNANNVAKLIEYADKGLYFAKEHGRNQVGKIEG